MGDSWIVIFMYDAQVQFFRNLNGRYRGLLDHYSGSTQSFFTITRLRAKPPAESELPGNFLNMEGFRQENEKDRALQAKKSAKKLVFA